MPQAAVIGPPLKLQPILGMAVVGALLVGLFQTAVAAVREVTRVMVEPVVMGQVLLVLAERLVVEPLEVVVEHLVPDYILALVAVVLVIMGKGLLVAGVVLALAAAAALAARVEHLMGLVEFTEAVMVAVETTEQMGLFVLFGPATLAHSHQLAQVHHEPLY